MAIVVEDGSIVANANSYVTVVEADAYASARNDAAWAGLSAQQKEAALLQAGLLLNNARRFPFRGTRRDYNQRMEWPRQDASEYRGPSIPNNVVPWRLKDAQCELARTAGSSVLQPSLEHGGRVTSETVDVISTDYADDAPGETLYPAAEGLLAPLLRDDRRPDTTPGVYQATDETPYVPGEFGNVGESAS